MIRTHPTEPGTMLTLFDRKALIGMVHVPALPGSPRHSLPIDRIIADAADEARILAESGFDALIIENMHDRPYIHGAHGPETVAAMTRAGLAVREVARRGDTPLPIGVQILSGGNREALAVALAIGASFIRCENFVFSHVADEGLLARAEAGPLLRYRRQIGAEHIHIFCDIKKKHASHAITADVSVAEAAEAAEFFGADGLIITGAATGKPARTEDVAEARRASRLPLLVGSGVTPEQVAPLLQHADALIIGSWIKRDGIWSNPIDPARCRHLAEAFNQARAG
ncbi:MAG: BtpA/SgcQ family protein [Phycisphaerales bacterium]|nr:BtpA/SgcQ family protein [Phycisphaerales bacterium]